MFDIGWGEFVVIGTVALVVIGPKELPGVLRTVGQAVGKVRRMASEFQGQFQEALREAEFDDARKTISGLNDSTSSFNPIQTIRDEIKGAVDGHATSPNPPALTSTAEAGAEPFKLDIPEAPPVPDLTPEQIQAAFVTDPLGIPATDVGAESAATESVPEKPKRVRRKAAAAEPPAIETASMVEAGDPVQQALEPQTTGERVAEPGKPPRRTRSPRKNAAAAPAEGGPVTGDGDVPA